MKRFSNTLIPEVILYPLAGIFSVLAAYYQLIVFASASTITGLVAVFFTTIRTSSRKLSEKRFSHLVAGLRRVSVTLSLRLEYEDYDFESVGYAVTVGKALTKADIKHNDWPRAETEQKETGLVLLVHDGSRLSKEAQALLTAFASAKVALDLAERKSLPEEGLVLAIGPKPLFHW